MDIAPPSKNYKEVCLSFHPSFLMSYFCTFTSFFMYTVHLLDFILFGTQSE